MTEELIKDSLPQFLIQMLKEQYGNELTEKIIQGYSKKRKLTFRVNTIKTSIDKVESILKQNKIQYKKPAWSDKTFIVENNLKEYIEKLDIYKDGEIYLQSLSSMLPPIILEPKENTDILDMAAAPRWKNNTNCSNYK